MSPGRVSTGPLAPQTTLRGAVVALDRPAVLLGSTSNCPPWAEPVFDLDRSRPTPRPYAHVGSNPLGIHLTAKGQWRRSGCAGATTRERQDPGSA